MILYYILSISNYDFHISLYVQAACFYVPHWIWKQLEGGRLQNIVQGLNQVVFTIMMVMVMMPMMRMLLKI